MLTKQYQTTTILYYAFFLPGIALHELTLWLVAGFLNVRADRAIKWPQKQEVGELKLNFIQLSPKVGRVREAIIRTAPLVVGIAATWHIASNVLNIPAFLVTMQGSRLTNLGTALGQLTTVPDFWLWFYLAFTISNTMMPDFSKLRGWRTVLAGIGVIAAALVVVGAGNEVVLNALRGPIANGLNAITGIFGIIIGLDLFMVAALGTVEAIIERITGNSATFKDGKMITMKRSEMLEQRQKALAAAWGKPGSPTTRKTAAASGPPSVYKLLLPIPGAPGKEAVTRDEGLVITPGPVTTQTPALEGRAGPALISGTATGSESKPAAPSTPATSAPRPPTLSGTASAPRSAPLSSGAATAPKLPAPQTSPVEDDEDDDFDEDDEITYEDAEDPA